MFAIICWAVILVAAVIVEAVTTGLISIWFAGGAAIALIMAIIGTTVWLQIVVFIVISVGLLFATKPFVDKKLKLHYEKTNVDALIGRDAIVGTEVSKAGGRVVVNGMDWAAVSSKEEIFKAQEKVIIVGLEGAHLIVERKGE